MYEGRRPSLVEQADRHSVTIWGKKYLLVRELGHLSSDSRRECVFLGVKRD